MKTFHALFLILTAVLFCSCRTVPYELTEKDKLTQQELYHIFDYSRHFVLSSQKVKLTEDMRQLITSKDPDVRVHYTAPKTGKLSLSWLIPGKLQIIVSADGRLDLSKAKQADWKLRIINYKRDCFMLPEEIGIPAVD